MSDVTFDVYQGMEPAKKLLEALENKYMAKDVSNKNFLVTQFHNYRRVDKRSVLDQWYEIQYMYLESLQAT